MNRNNDKRKYRFLENIAIADIAYEAYGKDLNEMFENSAMAIFELSANLKTVEAKKKTEFELENKKYQLKAILEGDTINPKRQQLENDIKAVTMHMFEVKKEKNMWKAVVVVDI